MIRRSVTLAAIAATALACGSAAVADPSSRVETQTRPNFGLLLKPQIRPHRAYRPWGGRPDVWRPRVWEVPPGAPAFQPGAAFLLVDCSNARDPNEVNRALAALKPGGTLILHAEGKACLDNVVITKPVTIQSDAGSPRNRDGGLNEDAVVLKPRPGGPCIGIEIDGGLQGEVVLRDIAIEAQNAGDETCVYSRNSKVRLERVIINYQGSGSALYVDGGEVDAADTLISANTDDRGVYVASGRIAFEDVFIKDAAIALEINSTDPEPSQLTRVTMKYARPEASRQFSAATVGVVTPGRGGEGRLVIDSSKICGFGIGLWVEGANSVDMNRSTVCRAGKGVVAAGGKLSLNGNRIGGNVVGLQIGAGEVEINDNDFFGAKYEDVFLEPGARLPRGSGNTFFSGGRVCQWTRVDDRFWGRDGRRWARRFAYLNYMPIPEEPWYQCEEGDRYLGQVQDEERQLGYSDDPADFYALPRWPEDRIMRRPYDHFDARSFDLRDYDRGPSRGDDRRYGSGSGSGSGWGSGDRRSPGRGGSSGRDGRDEPDSRH